MDLKLDVKDRKILYELDANARQSDADIGRKTGLSKEVVNYRIKRLVGEGVIRNFCTIIDASRMGYLSCRVFLKFQHDDPAREKKLIKFFVDDSRTWWVCSIDGSKDLAVVIWARNTYDFYDFLEKVLCEFKPVIRDFSPGIYVRFFQFRRTYLAGKEEEDAKAIESCTSQKAEVDETDLAILRKIAANARMPTVQIAAETGLTTAVVNYRIKKLVEKGVIQGFRSALDLQKLSYHLYKLNIDLEDFSKADGIISYAKSHPNVVYAYKVIGGANLELEIEARSYPEFRSIVDDFRTRFSKAVRYYDYFLFAKEHKILYMPMV